jgi:hypothetical protein
MAAETFARQHLPACVVCDTAVVPKVLLGTDLPNLGLTQWQPYASHNDCNDQSDACQMENPLTETIINRIAGSTSRPLPDVHRSTLCATRKIRTAG